MNKDSGDNKIDPENVITDELQDPMSGYTSADALSSETSSRTDERHETGRLRDPMSGYAGGDALKSDPKSDEGDVDRDHVETTQDSMSGYASADPLDTGEK